ncbi:glycoside hydrolase family protein [Novipirellula artificiosorum]|nr:hypothetical protein [Novipirellula artificiosorum]
MKKHLESLLRGVIAWTIGSVCVVADEPPVRTGVQIPAIVGDYTLIYKPQPDVYSGQDTQNYKNGETYTHWQTNDHTYIKGPDMDGSGDRWHCFGITRPDKAENDGVHEGEGTCFHALAPIGKLATAMRPQVWIDQPKLDVSGCGWAPHCIKIGEAFSLISSTNGRAESIDLFDWRDKGKLKVKGENTRDPDVLFWNGTYYLTRCSNRSVSLVTSVDFVNWTDPVNIFTAPQESWNCESPTLVERHGVFYLFWCLWDSAGSGEQLEALYDGHDPSTYDYRTFVYASDTPMDFHDRDPVAQLAAHAPEIIQDEEDRYFISSADYPQRGINLARLVWIPRKPSS